MHKSPREVETKAINKPKKPENKTMRIIKNNKTPIESF
jgi:hypothetical protein